MRQAEFNKLTFLKAFTYVDETLCIVRVEVRRDEVTGLTLSTRTRLTIQPNTPEYTEHRVRAH